jgi:uncharacterized membrane protein YraQ (UPF0718 family)
MTPLPNPSRLSESTGLTRRDRILLVAAAAVLFAIIAVRPAVPVASSWWEKAGPAADRVVVFTTVFLGIFVEALPFLLIGVVASSLIQVFVSEDVLARLVPRAALPAAALGGALGLAFPVCDCGAIPVSRRFLAKGAPLPLAVAFMLAAPVINPVVIVATWTAFGGTLPLLAFARFGAVYLVAVTVGLVFGWHGAPRELVANLATQTHDHAHEHAGERSFTEFARHATVELFEMGRFLVIGAALAAALQTYVSRAVLASVGQDPILSIVAMMVLAVALSVCSTVDAFVALSFVGTFSGGALLAFLTFGPMVDFKSSLMYTTTLRRPAVLLLVVLCAQGVFLVGALLNLVLKWF